MIKILGEWGLLYLLLPARGVSGYVPGSSVIVLKSAYGCIQVAEQMFLSHTQHMACVPGVITSVHYHHDHGIGRDPKKHHYHN